ncbi:MAG: cobalamin-dependent protein, partial [Verrucomicrobiae bacterium]|nr:cobalamin-dependent protein [Verrucomicrobiae bacterium]NNJ87276.1 methionine synthase [Akkermansiaceae bacterium]
VKGDVHDIGKNIVGVVLACNGFEVIDLGVMVPCEKILDVAAEKRADVIGLSGLITPSLDEMVNIAKEMERRELKTPILIGGATTSPAHTAVKIAPHYSGPIIHVLDASRSVPVTTSLLSEDGRDDLIAQNDAKHAKLRDTFNKKDKETISLEQARNNAAKINWDDYTPPTPEFTGTRVIENQSLRELVDYIDWTPFFHAWELRGVWDRETKTLKSKNTAAAEVAQKLYSDAQELLEEIIESKRFKAKGIYGFFPAYADGDDIILPEHNATFHTLRQQTAKSSGKPNYALSDFVRDGDLRSPSPANKFKTSYPDDETKIQKTRSRLPHWTQSGATYAVTFRLSDSLPRTIIQSYRQEKKHLTQLLNQAIADDNQALEKDATKQLEKLYREKIESALDHEHGACHMKNPDIAQIVADAITHFDGERYSLAAWCVMSNHVHLLIQPKPEYTLPDILKSIKNYSALQANKQLGVTGSFWQKESYDHLIRDEDDFWNQLEYIQHNPTKVGLHDYPFLYIHEDIDDGMTRRPEVAVTDHIGGFVVGIHGADEWAAELREKHEVDSAIMVQAIADRLAEAFAELLHHRARVAWGYERPNEFNHNELIKEIYQGIRPAPGYPAQPDHTEKKTLFKLLKASEQTDIHLTESCAMHPGAAVSGLLFSHPESKYFAISELQKDQVKDYAKRKGWT